MQLLVYSLCLLSQGIGDLVQRPGFQLIGADLSLALRQSRDHRLNWSQWNLLSEVRFMFIS